MTSTQLALKANEIRTDLLTMLAKAGSGHSAGPLGMADVLTALYFGGVLHYQPAKPRWPARDRLVLSNGHICPVLYATLAHAGFFPVAELATLRQLGSRLQGHPHRTSLPGLETTSGPLGSGLSQAVGMALAGRIDEARWRVVCVMSDGEQDEGNTWEAVMLAGKEQLGTLTALIDRNGIQIDGPTETVLPLESLRAKYEAFHWHVLEVDGHDIPAIVEAFQVARMVTDQPTVIVAHTTPGKGVGYMEGDYRWHGNPPGSLETERAPAKAKQLAVALADLAVIRETLRSDDGRSHE